MKITVVICTYRRPESLARALASIANAHKPLAADWNVLVVDNADCSRTQDLARSFADSLPIEVRVEPRAGLSHARNTAVAHMDGDYAIWTDDDVTVAPAWLRSYESSFTAHPEAAFFGGPIRPKFEGQPPAWLKAALPLVDTAFAALDLTGQAEGGRLGLNQLPFGANMAIRMRELRALPFDVKRGRQPGRWLLSGEESQLLRQICRGGGLGVWLPDAPVTHWIDAQRQTLAYLRRYLEGRAIHDARTALTQSSTREATTVRLWLELLGAELDWLRGWLLRDPARWVEALRKASSLRGTLAAGRELRRQGNRAQESAA